MSGGGGIYTPPLPAPNRAKKGSVTPKVNYVKHQVTIFIKFPNKVCAVYSFWPTSHLGDFFHSIQKLKTPSVMQKSLGLILIFICKRVFGSTRRKSNFYIYIRSLLHTHACLYAPSTVHWIQIFTAFLQFWINTCFISFIVVDLVLCGTLALYWLASLI